MAARWCYNATETGWTGLQLQLLNKSLTRFLQTSQTSPLNWQTQSWLFICSWQQKLFYTFGKHLKNSLTCFISSCLGSPSIHLVVPTEATVKIFFPWFSSTVPQWGEGYVGRVPSRRPSHSASTSGSNPPWRTWQIALATPAHSAAGVVAAWPGPAHQHPL